MGIPSSKTSSRQDWKADQRAIQQFNDDGFVIARQLFDPSEMNLLGTIARADRDLANEAYARKDSSGTQTRLALRNDLQDDCMYSTIVRSKRVAANMAILLNAEPYHYHHKMMLKEPRVGGAWEWHQDYGYWYNYGCLYPDMASCLIAVDRATKDNGCLQVIKGSQKIGRINHQPIGDQVGADPERVNEALSRLELVYAELEPGDAVFFHGNLLHRSDRNRSENPRWSLICCYNTAHNSPFFEGNAARHAHYSPLEILPDGSVMQVGQTQCDPLQLESASHQA
jgi:ectoine hydroxylase-related dioxygenase (phytanoyl-CoA dioxygenase family)